MSSRKDWSDEQLKQIWVRHYGYNNTGACPPKWCYYKNTLMSWSNYGNRTDTSWVVDHIIPLDRGGADHINNTQPMHNYCNLKKSNS